MANQVESRWAEVVKKTLPTQELSKNAAKKKEKKKQTTIDGLTSDQPTHRSTNAYGLKARISGLIMVHSMKVH